jgi:multiple sugar transport system permease protein
VLVLAAINIFPFLYAVYISLHNWWLNRRNPPNYIGWLNYDDALLYDDRVPNAVVVSLSFVGGAVLVEFLLGCALAFVFHARLRGFATLRLIAMLPIMVMPVVTGLLWLYLFNENYGPLNSILESLGLERQPFLSAESHALWSVIAADVWQWTPFIMIVMYAALQSLPEYVYEAARMDGLSAWQTFWRVTVPLLTPAAMVILLIRAVDAFRTFELVYTMTRGGPGSVTEILPYYIYLVAFQLLNIGYGAALAIIMLVLVTVLATLFVARMQKLETRA